MNTFLLTKRRTSSLKKTFSASFLRMAYGSVFALLLLTSGGVFGQTYTQVTTLANLTSGEYLIVGDGTNDGMMVNTIGSGPVISFTSTATSGVGSTITSGYSSENVFTITVSGTTTKTITIHHASVGYVSWGNAGTGTTNHAGFFNGAATTKEIWNATVSSNLWTLRNSANTTRILQWNSSSPRFAAYLSSSAQTNLTLYKKSGNTVTFDKNAADATGTMANQTAPTEAALNANNFERTGYAFAGWNTVANGDGDAYGNQALFPFAENKTLYAQWTANNNTITFDKNAVDATGSMSNQTLATAATANLTTNSYARAGYSFQGWATTSGGSVSYTDGASYTMGTSNATLFAKWLTNSPFINTTGTLVPLSSTYGTASTTTTFSFTGANLTGNVTVTAPSGFEVSTTAGSGYSSSISVAQTGGAIAATTIYVRLAAATIPGSYSGNVVLTSSGATAKNVATVSSTVTVKNLTIAGLTGDNKIYDGTTTATASGTAALSSIVGSDDVTLSGTPAFTFNNANVGTSKAITVTGYTLTGTTASRYTVSQPTGLTGNITAKALSISAASVASKVYNGLPATGTVTAGTLSGLIGTQTVTITPTGTYADATAGTGKTATISYVLSNGTNGGLATNYTLASGTATGTITKAPLTATADDKSKATGAANPTLTITYTGFVNSETTGTASGFTAPTISTTAVTLSSAGMYPITLAGGAADNYILTLVAGTLTVKDIYGGSGTFEKITDLTDLTDGYYVMAYGTTFAMNNSYVSSTYLDKTAINLTGGKVVDPPASIVWKIETNGGGRTIYNEGNEKYVSYTGSSNNVQVVDAVSADNQRWTPTYISGNFRLTNNAVTGRRIQYNNNAGQERFACYTSGQQDLTLYKITASCTPSANPVGTIGGTFSACATTNITYTGADAATSYWQTTATGTSTAEPVTTAKTVTMSGTYYVRNFASSCWSTASISQVVTIATPPSISTQPASKIAVAGGTAPTFSVTATGTGLTYQWQVDTGSGWSNVSTGTGGTTSSYTTVTPVLNMNDNAYRVIITGGSCGSITSNAASLTVDYCDSAPSSNDGAGITHVVMGSASFPVADVKYFNYTASVPDLIQGASITSSITFATGQTYNANIWIDFNDDGVFDTGELVFQGESLNANPTLNTGFTLAGAAVIGTHKMRIGTADFGQATPNPCYNGTWGVTIDLFVNIISSCTPNHTITSYSPTSGPEGTVITVVGTGFSVGTTATLGIESAAVSYINATEIKIVVPSGTTTSGLVISDAADCTLLAGTFTVLETTNTGCETTSEGGGSASDLIIFEVYDENGGSGGIISVFNNTGASVNLSGYTIERAGDYGATYAVYSTLSGILADNTVAVIAASGSKCLYTATGNGSVPSGGFNESDGFRLIKDGTLIDDVKAPNYLGYYLKRKITDLSPNTTFDISEWTTTAVVEDECLPGVAVVPLLKLPPVIITQPLENAQACGVTDATFTVSATEGVVGGLGITYQWYMNVPGNSGWATVSGTNFTGGTSVTLTVANASTYDGYQFYCEVRENTATCSTASEAVAIDGAVETIIYSEGTWIGGTPNDITKNVIIDAGSNYNTTSGAITARKLTNNGTLTVDVANPVIIEFELINNGTFNILNSGSLVQNCDVVNATTNNNIGSINMERITPLMFRYDFTYWSSPVKDFVLKSVSPNTLFDKFFSWNETSQTWLQHPTLTSSPVKLMDAGRGYSVRAPQSFNISTQPNPVAQTHTANFIGVPNNGIVKQPIAISDTDDKWNLIGNPYPSAIDGELFLAGNTNLGGTLYFWTHNSAPTGNANGYYTYNSADYAAWNSLGATQPCLTCIPHLGQIPAGQSFFVKGVGTSMNPEATFNNGMRLKVQNNQFLKLANDENPTTVTKHRIWLNLQGATAGFNQTLIGYVDGATNGLDSQFDGDSFGGNQVTFYSISDTKNLVIQGRALPFTVQDSVALGYKTTLTGNLTISIDHGDGLLENQAVYLKDNVLNVTHDLRASNYVFASTPGTFDSRFVLLYVPQEALANPTFNDQIKGMTIRKNNADLHVNSPYELIDIVRVYDITGRLVFEKKQCNSNRFTTSHLVGNDQTLIVKVQLVNGGVVTEKVY